MLEPREGCYSVGWWHIEAKRQALEGGMVDEMVSWFCASTTIALTGTATDLKKITQSFDKPQTFGSSTHVHSMVITIITYHTTVRFDSTQSLQFRSATLLGHLPDRRLSPRPTHIIPPMSSLSTDRRRFVLRSSRSNVHGQDIVNALEALRRFRPKCRRRVRLQ
jgi:hypothetical protein